MFKKIWEMIAGSKQYENISMGELADIIRKKKIELIDVRTIGEYRMGHIAGAKNIDVMSNDFQQKISKLNPQKTYYVYCKSGGRSASACNKMTKLGFENIYNVRGGVMAWGGQLKRK